MDKQKEDRPWEAMKVNGGPLGTLTLSFVFLETLNQITFRITKIARKESGWPVFAIMVIK